MSKLLKYTGDINKALRTVNQRLQSEGFDFITWQNGQTGARFIAKKETVKKMYLNKFENGTFDTTNEVIKVSNTSLTVNEMQEAGAGATLKEGMGGKEVTKISGAEINLLDEVLYNENFDLSVLFK